MEGRFVRAMVIIWLMLNSMLVTYAFAERNKEDNLQAPDISVNGGWGKVVPYAENDLPIVPEHDESKIIFLAFPLLAALLMIPDKRSQITIFLLLGLVIMIAFFMVYYLSSLGEDETEISISEAAQSARVMTAYKYYVYTCLDRASVEVLEDLGRQGGFIHDYQNGSIMPWSQPAIEYEIDNKTYNVSYQIYNDVGGQHELDNSFISKNFLYPCRKGYASAMYQPLMGDQCYYSYNHTLEAFGPMSSVLKFGVTGIDSSVNHRIIPDLCTESIDLAVYRCPCTVYGMCNYSIQRQLESAILNRTLECLDMTYYQGYNITYGNASMTVSFGLKDLSVLLHLPVTLQKYGGLPETTVSDFHALFKVRLKMIHALVFGGNFIPGPGMPTDALKGIINEDLMIGYDIVDDGQDLLNRAGGMTVTRFNPNPNVTLIMINDSVSKLDEDPYIFIFARENRRPALDYFSPGVYVWNNRKFDVYVWEGEDVNLTPQGVDPDEDNLRYLYSGWKADWDDVFDETTATQNTVAYGTNDWHASLSYTGGCQDDFYGFVTGKCGDIPTQRQDIGPHNVTVRILDDAGLEDTQVISILVDDEPKVLADVDNFYADVPNKKASIEDNYIMDMTPTIDHYGDPPLYFQWIAPPAYQEVLEDKFKTSFREDNAIHDFPYNGPLDIARMYLETQHFDRTGTFDITVNAKKDTGPVGTRTFSVEVEECLPHRNAATPSYPWNDGVSGLANELTYNTVSDPYQADHTCCSSSYTRVPRSDDLACFRLIDYGPVHLNGNANFPSIIDENHRYVGDSLIPIQSITSSSGGDPTSSQRFDVYKREFVVYCSGTSGNTCIPEAGNTLHTVTYVSSCPTDLTQHPQCSVAKYGSSPGCTAVSVGSAADPATGMVELNGICDATKKCSKSREGNVIVPPTGGACSGTNCYQCQSSCNGAGLCNWAINCKPCFMGCDDGTGVCN